MPGVAATPNVWRSTSCRGHAAFHPRPHGRLIRISGSRRGPRCWHLLAPPCGSPAGPTAATSPGRAPAAQPSTGSDLQLVPRPLPPLPTPPPLLPAPTPSPSPQPSLPPPNCALVCIGQRSCAARRSAGLAPRLRWPGVERRGVEGSTRRRWWLPAFPPLNIQVRSRVLAN